MTDSTSSISKKPSAGTRTRQEILRQAVDIASAEGLEGLTIGKLAKEVEMSKSGLFAHFGSKVDLQLATIETARDIFMQKIIEPASKAERGLDRLTAMIDLWLSYVENSVFRGGCFFAAASAEFDGRLGPVRELIAELTKSWVDALEEETKEAQKLRQLKKDLDPGQLVFELHAFVQEANWAFQLLGNANAFERARTAIQQRFQIHQM